MSPKLLAVPAALLVLALLAVVAVRPALQGADERSADSKAAPKPSSAPVKLLPAPQKAVLMTISGVGPGNAGAHTTKVDFATLDKAAREEITVYEPFLKRDVKFKGIRMSALLPQLGVPASATKIYMHALDDYHVNLPLAEVAKEGFFATRMNGKPIAVAKGGPARLVLTGGKIASNTDNWIWSVDRIRVSG